MNSGRSLTAICIAASNELPSILITPNVPFEYPRPWPAFSCGRGQFSQRRPALCATRGNGERAGSDADIHVMRRTAGQLLNADWNKDMGCGDSCGA